MSDKTDLGFFNAEPQGQYHIILHSYTFRPPEFMADEV